jgi:primosomal protein N'
LHIVFTLLSLPPCQQEINPVVEKVEKVKFSADYLKQELEKAVGEIKDLVIAGPAPAPLMKAETYYRYQIMLRAQRMAALSQRLALMIRTLTLPEDVTLAVDIDPVDLA